MSTKKTTSNATVSKETATKASNSKATVSKAKTSKETVSEESTSSVSVFVYNEKVCAEKIATARAELTAAIKAFNTGDNKNKPELLEKADKAAANVNAAILDDLYGKHMNDANPMYELLKVGFWDGVKVKREIDKDTKEVISISEQNIESFIDVINVEDWALQNASRSVVNGNISTLRAKIKDMQKILLKALWLDLHNDEVKADPEKMNEFMRPLATSELDGEAYKSGNKMRVAVQSIMDEICVNADNPIKCIGRDVRFLRIKTTRDGKAKLSVTTANADHIRTVITMSMYRIINDYQYGITTDIIGK